MITDPPESWAAATSEIRFYMRFVRSKYITNISGGMSTLYQVFGPFIFLPFRKGGIFGGNSFKTQSTTPQKTQHFTKTHRFPSNWIQKSGLSTDTMVLFWIRPVSCAWVAGGSHFYHLTSPRLGYYDLTWGIWSLHVYPPPKTNIASEKWWLEDYFIYFPSIFLFGASKGLFSGAFAVVYLYWSFRYLPGLKKETPSEGSKDLDALDLKLNDLQNLASPTKKTRLYWGNNLWILMVDNPWWHSKGILEDTGNSISLYRSISI